MRRMILAAGLLLVGAAAGAAEVKPYPGATVDAKATERAQAAYTTHNPNGKATVLTSRDSYEKVAAYYKKLGHEYRLPGAAGSEERQLPDGTKVRQVFVILDNGKDIVSSKRYVSVSRPMVLEVDKEGRATGVQDVTAIVMVEKP